MQVANERRLHSILWLLMQSNWSVKVRAAAGGDKFEFGQIASIKVGRRFYGRPLESRDATASQHS